MTGLSDKSDLFVIVTNGSQMSLIDIRHLAAGSHVRRCVAPLLDYFRGGIWQVEVEMGGAAA